MPLNEMLEFKKDGYGTLITAAPGITGVSLPAWAEVVTNIPMSFVTAEQMQMRIYFPFAVTITKIRGIVTSVVSGTADGTITCGNSTGASTNGVLTITLSSAVGAKFTATPTTNNTVAADSYYYLTSLKTLTGGLVDCTLEYTRTA